MSDEYTRVNAQKMRAGIDDLETAKKRLDTELSTLEEKLQTGLKRWEGDAQAAHHRAQAVWNSTAQHQSVIIATMNTVLSAILVAYNTTEQQNQDMY